MEDRAPGDWTVLDLLAWTRRHFLAAGVDQPRLTAELLLAEVLGCRRIQLYTGYDRRPDEAQRARFRRLVVRAAAGEPAAYLLGRKEFYSLTFQVTPEVLIPRPETEIIVAESLRHLGGLGGAGEMWDVCTGSGCVAVAAAVNRPGLSVLATDISAAAVRVACANAAAHGVADRVRCHVADLLERPAAFDGGERFDVIAANPPYVADDEEVAPEVHHEPQLALRAGPDGMSCLAAIIAAAPQSLAPGGALVLEFGWRQADQVRDLIVAAGGFCEPRIIRDHQNMERLAVAVRRR